MVFYDKLIRELYEVARVIRDYIIVAKLVNRKTINLLLAEKRKIRE